MKTKHLKIQSKLRFTIFVSILLILSISFVNTVLGFNDTNGATEKTYTQIEVVVGDTLWDIANEYTTSSTDTREAVYKICQANDIKADDLTPGMILNIPDEF